MPMYVDLKQFVELEAIHMNNASIMITTKKEDVSTINLSFAGCGFLCIYHAGVVAAIKEYAPQLISNRISGASAGAIAAAGLLCNVCISKSMEIILNVVKQARSGSLRAMSPMFNLIGMVQDGLEQILPTNAHKICTGRLFISLTRARDYKNVVVSEYKTRHELIQAIVCSSFIPFYCGLNPPLYRGEAYIDGGMSDNQPNLDRYTISVSPFSGESDICPLDVDSGSMIGVNFFGTSIRCTSANLFRMVVCLFPPSQDVCADICRQGFADTMRFLRNRGLAPCSRCLALEARVFAPIKIAAQEQLRPQQQMNASNSTGTLRRVKTMPNFAKPTRLEECDRCLEKFDIGEYYYNEPFDLPLPELVQRTLNNAILSESKWYVYLQSFRLFRWTMRFMTPVIFPFELMMFTARKIQARLTSLARSDFYIERLQRVANVVLAEVDARGLIFDEDSFASTSSQIFQPYYQEPQSASSFSAELLQITTAAADDMRGVYARSFSAPNPYASVSDEGYISAVSDPSSSSSYVTCSNETQLQEFKANDKVSFDVSPSCHFTFHRKCSPVMENVNSSDTETSSNNKLTIDNLGNGVDGESESCTNGDDSGFSLAEDSSPADKTTKSTGVRKRDLVRPTSTIVGRVNFSHSTNNETTSSSSGEDATAGNVTVATPRSTAFRRTTSGGVSAPKRVLRFEHRASDDDGDERLFVPRKMASA